MRWLCICDCGAETAVLSSHLGSGKIQSCGCLRLERTVAAHRRGPNRVKLEGATARVELRDRKDELIGYFLIDTTDVELIKAHRWYRTSGYVGAQIYNKEVRLHRFLMGPGPAEMIDHRNGNKFDNRRENLRLCGRVQNGGNMTKLPSTNRSGFIGVHFNKSVGKWIAQCRRKHLGCFRTPEEAAEAYDAAAKEEYGEFATRINKRRLDSEYQKQEPR